MKTGALDRRVQFMRTSMIDDGQSVRPGPFAPLGRPVWASKTPVSDGERFRADSVARDMTDRFVVRWSNFTATVSGSDRLVCEGVTYGVVGIKEVGRREGLEITAGRINEV